MLNDLWMLSWSGHEKRGERWLKSTQECITQKFQKFLVLSGKDYQTAKRNLISMKLKDFKHRMLHNTPTTSINLEDVSQSRLWKKIKWAFLTQLVTLMVFQQLWNFHTLRRFHKILCILCTTWLLMQLIKCTIPAEWRRFHGKLWSLLHKQDTQPVQGRLFMISIQPWQCSLEVQPRLQTWWVYKLVTRILWKRLERRAVQRLQRHKVYTYQQKRLV